MTWRCSRLHVLRIISAFRILAHTSRLLCRISKVQHTDKLTQTRDPYNLYSCQGERGQHSRLAYISRSHSNPRLRSRPIVSPFRLPSRIYFSSCVHPRCIQWIWFRIFAERSETRPRIDDNLVRLIIRFRLTWNDRSGYFCHSSVTRPYRRCRGDVNSVCPISPSVVVTWPQRNVIETAVYRWCRMRR